MVLVMSMNSSTLNDKHMNNAQSRKSIKKKSPYFLESLNKIKKKNRAYIYIGCINKILAQEYKDLSGLIFFICGTSIGGLIKKSFHIHEISLFSVWQHKRHGLIFIYSFSNESISMILFIIP